MIALFNTALRTIREQIEAREAEIEQLRIAEESIEKDDFRPDQEFVDALRHKMDPLDLSVGAIWHDGQIVTTCHIYLRQHQEAAELCAAAPAVWINSDPRFTSSDQSGDVVITRWHHSITIREVWVFAHKLQTALAKEDV